MFTIGLLFSSFRNYLIQEAISEYGSQHVILTTSQTLKKTADIEKLKYQDGQYYITYIKPQKTYKITEQLCQKYSCQKIVYNDKLLSLYGASQNENLLTTLITLLVTILIILGLCVALIIYNSFAISLAKRQRDLAAFKSLGMSKRQIRHLLYFESFLILSLGIFIGFIFSFLLSGGLIYMINHLLSDIFISKLHLSIYPIFIVIPLIFMALITFSSAFIPALKASKVPIISSLRNSTTFTYKKLPHWAQKLSIPSKLAYQNYKRYKRKYRPVVICIVINTVLISTFSLYLSYSLKSIQDYSNIPPFDLQITTQGSYQPALTEFAQKENLTIYNLFDHCEFSANLSTSSYLNKEDYQEKINLLIAQSDQEGIINRLKMTKEQNGQLVKIDKAYLKDEVMLTLNENSLNFNTINKIPLGFDSLLENNVIFLTPDINHYCTNPSTTIFLQGKVANLKSKLTNLANEYHISGLEYVDINKVNHLTNNFILACKIVLYSLTGLIVLIGITSVLSTI